MLVVVRFALEAMKLNWIIINCSRKMPRVLLPALGGFNNSKRDIQLILSQIFNLNISLGLISNSEARVSAKLETKYNELVSMAESSEYLH